MKPRRPQPARNRTRSASTGGKQAHAVDHNNHSQHKKVEQTSTSSSTSTSSRERKTPTSPVLTLGGHDGMTVPWTTIALTVVVLFAMYVIFPSLRSYLVQKQQYDDVIAQVRSTQELNQSLENELQRWSDDDFVRSQARDRLGYVMPGETTYIVVAPGHMTESESHNDPAGPNTSHEPWFTQLNHTVQLAGEIVDRNQHDPAQRGWTTPAPSVTQPASDSTP